MIAKRSAGGGEGRRAEWGGRGKGEERGEGPGGGGEA